MEVEKSDFQQYEYYNWSDTKYLHASASYNFERNIMRRAGSQFRLWETHEYPNLDSSVFQVQHQVGVRNVRLWILANFANSGDGNGVRVTQSLQNSSTGFVFLHTEDFNRANPSNAVSQLEQLLPVVGSVMNVQLQGTARKGPVLFITKTAFWTSIAEFEVALKEADLVKSGLK
uniref:Uncharacterized protein n=1 Tax=Tanacetum cinerariifolium TaxID=118510 RepID=A0A6L2JRN0_TANCI|nr:hypothetical protein [Tanacetum cinerariifolium]